MSEPYVPTDEEVRTDYVMAYTDRESSQLLAGLAFDRWLAAHDARVKAEAWDEGYDAGYDHAPMDRYSEPDPEPLPNPYGGTDEH